MNLYAATFSLLAYAMVLFLTMAVYAAWQVFNRPSDRQQCVWMGLLLLTLLTLSTSALSIGSLDRERNRDIHCAVALAFPSEEPQGADSFLNTFCRKGA